MRMDRPTAAVSADRTLLDHRNKSASQEHREQEGELQLHTPKTEKDSSRVSEQTARKIHMKPSHS